MGPQGLTTSYHTFWTVPRDFVLFALYKWDRVLYNDTENNGSSRGRMNMNAPI